MTRRAKGTVYRPTVTGLRGGRRIRRKAKFFWARYNDETGVERNHVLRLTYGDRVTDKEVARSELDKVLNRIERKSVGLIDPIVESAGLPLRVALGRYARHVRRKARSRGHIRQTIRCVKWLIDNAPMERLCDFRADFIDKALGQLADKGAGPRTVNAYRSAAFGFGEWAVRIAKLLDRNPMREIERRDPTADVRKVRRALIIDEAYRLLGVSEPRRLFYAVALWTGLRVGEVEALEWRDLDLDADRPCIHLRAATTKAKRADAIPLHRDLATLLRSAKPAFALPTDRVVKVIPNRRTFKGFHDLKRKQRYTGDIERAGIPFADDKGRTIDRHALRTTFVSWLGLYGVDPRAQVALARHAPTGITLRHYQDFSLFDLWGEIEKLPAIRWNQTEAEALRATGTDGANPVARPVAQNTFREGEIVSGIVRTSRDSLASSSFEKRGNSIGKIAFPASNTHYRRVGSNHRPPDPQSGALTN